MLALVVAVVIGMFVMVHVNVALGPDWADGFFAVRKCHYNTNISNYSTYSI